MYNRLRRVNVGAGAITVLNEEVYLSKVSSPLLARLTSPVGPPKAMLLTHSDSSILVLPCRYCVTYIIVSSQNAVIVDVGSISDIRLILDALDWLKINYSQVKYIMPTHLHFDHIMGMDALANLLGVSIALSRVAYEHLANTQPFSWPRGLQLLRAVPTWVMQGMPFPPLEDFARSTGFGVPWGKNNFTAKTRYVLKDKFELPEMMGWEVIETPGHSDDSICLFHKEAGFLITGDTIRNFLGGEWNPLLSKVEAYESSKEKIKALKVNAVLPAHGPIIQGTNVISDIKSFPPYVP